MHVMTHVMLKVEARQRSDGVTSFNNNKIGDIKEQAEQKKMLTAIKYLKYVLSPLPPRKKLKSSSSINLQILKTGPTFLTN